MVHVYTQKGRGSKLAEKDAIKYYSLGGQINKNNGSTIYDYSKVFGHSITQLAKKDNKIICVTAAMEIGTGMVIHRLNEIADVMEKVFSTTNQKVVVHCAMGMERSVLAIVYFMATKWGMQLQQALKQVQSKRPIALDRLHWITL